MFLKSLVISSQETIIREINFRSGINLIIDEDNIISDDNIQSTGNDIGKTTVLKLIDFCLGAKAKNIYSDPESKKKEYALVKKFLKGKEVIITLILKENLQYPNSTEIKIERNFLQRKQAIRRVNGKQITEKAFETELSSLIFPHHKVAKPTFRQIISHNFRYKEHSLKYTLKTLSGYTTDEEYETLHLFLLGCQVNSGSRKQQLTTAIKQEIAFKKRLEKKQSKTEYEAALAILDSEIRQLNKQKKRLNLNKNFETDLEKLNIIKYQLTKTSSTISRLQIRKDIILEAKQELELNKTNIDIQQLQLIYQQATEYITNLQKTFEELVHYHNQMIIEKVRFITEELPELEQKLSNQENQLKRLRIEEVRLTNLLTHTSSFKELEALIIDLNEKFKKKGEYENIIKQVEEVEQELEKFNQELNNINDNIFSIEFEQKVKQKRDRFNHYFANISNELYGEKYALTYNIVEKKGKKLYKFSTFDVNKPNLSSGKKQGEISSFDIAYALFADSEKLSCLHFILNDKKELMDDNQLIKIAELVNQHDVQFVASILKDKLPIELNKEKYFILKLSQADKLFRIENYKG